MTCRNSGRFDCFAKTHSCAAVMFVMLYITKYPYILYEPGQKSSGILQPEKAAGKTAMQAVPWTEKNRQVIQSAGSSEISVVLLSRVQMPLLHLLRQFFRFQNFCVWSEPFKIVLCLPDRGAEHIDVPGFNGIIAGAHM